MNATLDPRTETYRDVEKMIHQVAHKFARRYGGDHEELVSIAHEGFVLAYNSHDPATSNFTTWVYWQMWYAMMNSRRADARHLAQPAGDAAVDWVAPEGGFDLDAFIEGLGNDAVTVLRLVFETPAEVAAVAEAKGGHALNLRSTIREYLRGLGWTAARIAESFEEIGDALRG